jgi:O-methyltransferase
MNVKQTILNFNNTRIDPSIINSNQIDGIVTHLIEIIENSIEGDVVELGCYVGESSKYIAKTLLELKSDKKYYVYDSFEGLPDVSEYEKNTGWRPGTLKTSEDIFRVNLTTNNLPCPVITKGWFKDIPDVALPPKISFAFLDGDFYTSIYESLEKIYNKVSDGGYILVHDYDRPDLPGVKAAIVDFFNKNNYPLHIDVVCDQLAIICKNKELKSKPTATVTSVVSAAPQPVEESNLTIVTGIWDLRRDQAGEGFKRPFSHYTDNFIKLLKTNINMVVFVEESMVDFVRQHRQDHNTRIIVRNVQSFKDNFAFYDQVQKIRTNPAWYNSASWLKDSTQASLEMYNPMVMSKFFMLHDAVCFNHFNTDYFAWIDGGLTNTVHEGYFTHDKVLNKVTKYLNKLFFISFPYEGNTEIHGFDREGMNKYSNTDYVRYVCRGGFFGGHKDYIRKYNSIYYHLLNNTLAENYMGTEESIFTIMAHQNSNDIDRHMIEDNGLISRFFEAVKTDTVKIIKTSEYTPIINPKVSLYVLTYNSPKQFEVLVESYKNHKDFITNTKNYLIDNSTDASTDAEYTDLCKKYNFERIKKDNIGICGGRQFIAEHFDGTDSDYYIFLEDDMNLMPENNEVCVSGFRRYTPDLFFNSLKIINEEGYDFLKLSFSEFFGTNTTQWAWYNVPQNTREKYFPEKITLPRIGTDPNAPKTKFNNIKCKNNLAYVDGEVYYCNWPQFVSREGNKKMFLDTKWARPYEQTWMSHMFQLTKDNKLKGSLLLLSPINHHRFHHYESSQRKES